MKKKCVMVLPEIHRRLRMFSATKECNLNSAISMLLNNAERTERAQKTIKRGDTSE